MIPLIKKREAVITGCGVINAVANSQAEFTQAMKVCRSGLDYIESFDAEGMRNPKAFEAKFFDKDIVCSSRGEKKMDRSSALVLAAFDQAIKMSKLNTDEVRPSRGAVFSGSTLGGAVSGFKYYRRQRQKKFSAPISLRDYPLFTPGYRICIETGFTGPNIAFSTACTSSNLAIASSMDLILADQADVCVVVGFDPMSEISTAGFSVMRNVAPDVCRPFDRKRQGLVLGEGSAVLIVEADDYARRRGATPLAMIRGYGVTSDAYHMTAPDISASGAVEAIKKALHMGQAPPQQIDFICAHGTGTPHNDSIEAKALHITIGKNVAHVPVSSIKSMVGHTLGAAGAMNVVATIAARAGGIIPPTINHNEADFINPLACSSSVRDGRPRFVLSNTFGFGGSNCSIFMEMS